MNDSDDVIVVRNPPNSRQFLSSTQQPSYNSTIGLSESYDPNLTEDMIRKRQSEYAEELRWQILQRGSFEDQAYNYQPRAFMSSLGSLHGDKSIEIERKKRQQEKFAESLRKQIEEKRREREIEKQKEETREASYYSNPAVNSNEITYNSVSSANHEHPISNNTDNTNNRSNRYLRQTRKTNFQTQPISRVQFKLNQQNQPPKPLSEIDNNNTNFSKTVPFGAMPHLTFDIPSESPFARSTVQTPPLGFSLRRDNPISFSVTAPIPQNDPPLSIAKNNFSKSALSQHQMPHQQTQQTQQAQKTRILNNYKSNSNTNNSINKYDHQINLSVRSDEVPMRLGTTSELVYPDGHISPINSPH